MSSLRASDIRFTQDTIGIQFQTGGSVNEAAEDVCAERLSVDSFPAIQVVKLHKKYYSLDNRRLYVFRVAEYRGVELQIPVKIVAEPKFVHGRFTTTNDGRKVRVRGDPKNTKKHCKKNWLMSDTSLKKHTTYGKPITQSPANLSKSFRNIENHTRKLEPRASLDLDRHHQTSVPSDEVPLLKNGVKYDRSSSPATNKVRIHIDDDEDDNTFPIRPSCCSSCVIM